MTNDSGSVALELDNQTDVSNSGYVAYSQRLETYIVPIVFGVIFLVGVVGNGCVVLIICRHKSMRNLPNLYIFNLSLGDLLILVCSVPFTATIYTFESWPYGEFVCKASEFVKDTSVGISVFTLTVLSFDRYTAIVKPVESYVSSSKSKLPIIICLGIIWLISVGLALPAAVFSHLISVPGERIPHKDRMLDINGTEISSTHREILICYPFPPELGPAYPKIVIVTRLLIHYCLPLLVIGTFYTIMARHLLHSVQLFPGQAALESGLTRRRRQTSETSSNNNRESRIKVAKMVQCFVVLFAICFLPTHIFSMWFHFDPNSRKDFNHFWNAFRIFGFVLAYSNSCINPIALYCVSTNFRKHFNRLLCCRNDGDVSVANEGISRRFRREHRTDDEFSLPEFHGQRTRPVEHASFETQTAFQSQDDTC